MAEDVCQTCGWPQRQKDKSAPCELCGSREYPGLGYLYEHEEQPVRRLKHWAIGIIVVAPLVWLFFFNLLYGVDALSTLLFVLSR